MFIFGKIIRLCIILFLGFSIIFSLYSIYRDLIEEKLIEKTKIQGNEIVDALERYFAENKRYPDSLDKLVPKYLTKIPRPKWGQGWRYISGGESFFIETGYKDILGGNEYYPSLQYFIEIHEWLLDS